MSVRVALKRKQKKKGGVVQGEGCARQGRELLDFRTSETGRGWMEPIVCIPIDGTGLCVMGAGEGGWVRFK